jgi:hypothetical protein
MSVKRMLISTGYNALIYIHNIASRGKASGEEKGE